MSPEQPEGTPSYINLHEYTQPYIHTLLFCTLSYSRRLHLSPPERLEFIPASDSEPDTIASQGCGNREHSVCA